MVLFECEREVANLTCVVGVEFGSAGEVEWAALGEKPKVVKS